MGQTVVDAGDRDSAPDEESERVIAFADAPAAPSPSAAVDENDQRRASAVRKQQVQQEIATRVALEWQVWQEALVCPFWATPIDA
jgi:hypothetical protein